MARANNSLPTPDSPSTSTGMLEAAAFCAVRSTAAMVSLRVMMSAKVSRPSRLWRMRCSSPLSARGVERVAQRHLQPFEADRLDHEILRAGAHRRNHIVDAAMGGLHDDGDVQACFTHFCKHAEPVEAGHHEVEHDRVDRLRIGGGQQGHGGVAAIDDEGLIAALLHHVFNQTALHGVVVGNQNGGSHGFPRTLLTMYRIGALSPMPINALLNVEASAAKR